MAKKKKSRVPAPPRPVQAPKRRAQAREPRNSRLWFLIVAAVVVLAAAVVGIAMAVGGGESGIGPTGQDGPCTRETFPPQGRRHVDQLAEGFEYSSDPPTSGPHFGVPAIWNLYDRPVEDLRLVHNLEHGGVVVQYGDDVPDAVVGQLTQWYNDSPLGLIVAPRPELGSEIALTAWTHLMTCSTFDEGAFDRFRDDYRGPGGDAPEKFPLEALQPGST